MEGIETITFEADDQDAWICFCGNTPRSAGFYPCDLNGNIVEPTEKDWKTDLYVCDDCGRIIDYKTLKVVGRNLEIASRHEKRIANLKNQAQADFEKWIGTSRS
jgi:Zn-finger protein